MLGDANRPVPGVCVCTHVIRRGSMGPNWKYYRSADSWRDQTKRPVVAAAVVVGAAVVVEVCNAALAREALKRARAVQDATQVFCTRLFCSLRRRCAVLWVHVEQEWTHGCERVQRLLGSGKGRTQRGTRVGAERGCCALNAKARPLHN